MSCVFMLLGVLHTAKRYLLNKLAPKTSNDYCISCFHFGRLLCPLFALPTILYIATLQEISLYKNIKIMSYNIGTQI